MLLRERMTRMKWALGMLIVLTPLALCAQNAGTNQAAAVPPPWKVYEFDLLTVPFGGKPVTVDGALDLDAEWKDACAMTGFYQKDLNAIASPEAQMVFLVKMDEKFLYVAARSKIYPTGSQLTSFEKERDKADGIMSGDHMVLEVLPVKTRDAGRIAITGSFTLLWNVMDTLSDQHLNVHPGQQGMEWSSGAQVASRVSPDYWDTELKLPLESLSDRGAAPYVSVPPKPGDYWSLGVARRFGKAGENLFVTWDNHPLTIQEPGMGAQCEAWRKKPMIRFGEKTLMAVQIFDLGNQTEGTLATDIRLFNADAAEHLATVELHVQDSQGKKLWEQSQDVKVGPGQLAHCPPFKAQVKTEPRGSRLFIRITQDKDKPLFTSAPMDLVRFDDITRQQFRRSLEVLHKP